MNSLKKLLAGSGEGVPRCVNSLTISGWNPPPSNRRLAGDLFYIEIAPLEGRTLHVTACRNGFFVNGSSENKFVPTKSSSKPGEFHTLIGLLYETSRGFVDGFTAMLGVRSSRHPFEATPLPLPVQGRWCAVPGEEHTFDRNRASLSMSSTNPSLLNAGIVSVSGTRSGAMMSNGLGGTLTGFEPRNMQNRDWNEEYQSCKELPAETEDQRILRDRTIWKVHSDFVETATKIAVGIVNKEFAPINPMDPKPAHVYIQNNIFFTFATFNDSSPELKDLGVEEGSYYLSKNDLLGIQTFNSLDMPGIYTLPTTLIDYRGFRLSAQSIIPGILQADHLSLLKYGSLDAGKTIKWDEEFHELISAATSRLHLTSCKVRDANNTEAELASPVELKGIRGADGRKYILDLVRMTPHDPNFDHIPTAIFRPELVEEYCAYTTQMQIEEKTKEFLAEQRQSQDQGESSSSAQNIASRIQVDPIFFNPNCLVPPSSHISLCGSEEEQQADIAQIRKLADFLVNLAIPSLVADEATLEFNILDGPSLTELMHSRGINMRYLGKVAEISLGLPFLHRLCLQEMVVRAAKFHFKEMLRNTPDELLLSTIEAFLNGLFGHTAELKETDPSTGKKNNKGKGRQQSALKTNDLSPQNLHHTIHRIVKDKFNYELPEGYFLNNVNTNINSTSCSGFGMSKLSTLRSFCLRVGLVIACESYDFSKKKIFSVTDINDLQPIIKHTSPKSSLAHELLRSGKGALSTGNFEQAFELLNQALMTFQQIKGPMNFETATCLSNLATLLFNANDFQQAILHQHKALIISRRVLGHDSALTASIYQLIGLQCHSSGHTEFALKHFLRSRFICELIYGTDHPETATTLTNIAIMYQDLGYHVRSLKYLKEALRINETLLGPDHSQTAASLHALAVTLSMMGQYKESLMNERRAYKILSSLFGDEDPRVKESSSWLQHFTARAVEAQKELRKVQEEETRKFLAQTPPVLAKALKGLNLTNPTIDIKQLEAIVAKTKQQQQQMQTQQLSSKGAKFKKATTPQPPAQSSPSSSSSPSSASSSAPIQPQSGKKP